MTGVGGDSVTGGVPAQPAAVERCGCWVSVGGYDSICFLPLDHAGTCLPLRSECMTQAEHCERQAQAIYDAVTALDKDGGWPYEGPEVTA